MLNPKAVIYANEIFDKLKEVGKSLDEVSVDTVDYRAALREAQDEDEKVLYVKMVAIKRLAVTANRNLDDAFQAIFQ